MITTKVINVDLEKGRNKLRRVTTKDVDASIKVKIPDKSVKTKSLTTSKLMDVGDIIEKRRRDEIMAQRKANDSPQFIVNEDGDIRYDELKRLNMQFVFVELYGLIQGVSRRELK